MGRHVSTSKSTPDAPRFDESCRTILFADGALGSAFTHASACGATTFVATSKPIALPAAGASTAVRSFAASTQWRICAAATELSSVAGSTSSSQTPATPAGVDHPQG
jgi:hypothetical protein